MQDNSNPTDPNRRHGITQDQRLAILLGDVAYELDRLNDHLERIEEQNEEIFR